MNRSIGRGACFDRRSCPAVPALYRARKTISAILRTSRVSSTSSILTASVSILAQVGHATAMIRAPVWSASRTRTRLALSSPVPRISVKKFPLPPPKQKAPAPCRCISTSSRPGMASLSKVFKAALADTPLVQNLKNCEYMDIILNGCPSLAERFSQIDAHMVQKKMENAKKSSERISPAVKKLIRDSGLTMKISLLFSSAK